MECSAAEKRREKRNSTRVNGRKATQNKNDDNTINKRDGRTKTIRKEYRDYNLSNRAIFVSSSPSLLFVGSFEVGSGEATKF